MRVEDVRRIVVLRANGLGDLCFGLPALDALRAAYADAELVLWTSRLGAALFADRPGPVDRVLVVGVGSAAWPTEADRLAAPLRAEGVDLALQMHGGGRESNALVRALGAPVTAGCRTPDALPLDRELPYIYYQHEVLRLLEVAGLVGAPPVRLTPRLAVTAGDRAAAAEVTGELPPYVVIAPGATDGRRRWPPASFGAVGDALAADGFAVVVSGGPGEEALAAEVVGHMRAPARSVAGALSLPALVGLLAGAALVIGNDTGPTHLAEAVGAATVAVYWCGNVINAAPFFRVRHRPLLSWRLTCPVCGTDTTAGSCPHDPSFVADVPVADVLAAARDVLARDAVSAARSG